MRYVLMILTLACVAAFSPVQAQQPLNVIATFSILGDFAKNVGGDRVAVATLVGPDSDTHVYTPTPSDAKKITDAKLVIVNGLGLEGWLPRLVKSSGGRAVTVIATKGIAARKVEDGHGHDPGDADPHAWQSVANAKVYVTNIRDALLAADPAGADTYRANAAAYLSKLDVLDAEVREAVGKIPPERRSV
ncbi:MAG TPA: zinc ABC transporter substrate-binding protein, partial [Afipia sp.]